VHPRRECNFFEGIVLRKRDRQPTTKLWGHDASLQQLSVKANARWKSVRAWNQFIPGAKRWKALVDRLDLLGFGAARQSAARKDGGWKLIAEADTSWLHYFSVARPFSRSKDMRAIHLVCAACCDASS